MAHVLVEGAWWHRLDPAGLALDRTRDQRARGFCNVGPCRLCGARPGSGRTWSLAALERRAHPRQGEQAVSGPGRELAAIMDVRTLLEERARRMAQAHDHEMGALHAGNRKDEFIACCTRCGALLIVSLH